MVSEWLSGELPEIEEIQERLKAIFPREIDVNGYIIREMGAKTVFTMLYSFVLMKRSGSGQQLLLV